MGIPIFAVIQEWTQASKAKYITKTTWLWVMTNEKTNEGEKVWRVSIWIDCDATVSFSCLPTLKNQSATHPETFESVKQSCRHFRKSLSESPFAAAQAVLARSKSDADEVTHSFWLYSDQHGCSFWSQDLPSQKASGEYQERSTEIHWAGNLRKNLVLTIDSFAARRPWSLLLRKPRRI